MNEPSQYEDHVKWRVSRCANDIAIKTVAATTFSVVGAKFFLKKVSTSAAAVTGLGVALGMTYKNCEREIQLALTPRQDKPPPQKRSQKYECIQLDGDGKQADQGGKEDKKGGDECICP